MGYPVTLLRGDGIGPEVTEAARIAVDATGVAIDWNIVDPDLDKTAKSRELQVSQVLGAMRETKVALSGPFTLPMDPGTVAVMAQVRQHFQLYAHQRLAKSMIGTKSRFSDVDLTLIYENFEDVSADIEFERTTNEAADVRDYLARVSGIPIYDDAAVGVRLVSVLGCRRIIEYAFEYAQAQQRRKVTVVHRANALPFTDGLFLDIAHEMAKDYRRIEFDDCLADNICTQLIQQPQQYDVCVMPPLYAPMLSDLCTALNGGLGLTPCASIGDEHAVFEAGHGPLSQLAGQNIANPTALILSGVMLLQHLGELDAAKRLQGAVATVIAQKKTVADGATAGTEGLGTREIADAIASAI